MPRACAAARRTAGSASAKHGAMASSIELTRHGAMASSIEPARLEASSDSEGLCRSFVSEPSCAALTVVSGD